MRERPRLRGRRPGQAVHAASSGSLPARTRSAHGTARSSTRSAPVNFSRRKAWSVMYLQAVRGSASASGGVAMARCHFHMHPTRYPVAVPRRRQPARPSHMAVAASMESTERPNPSQARPLSSPPLPPCAPAAAPHGRRRQRAERHGMGELQTQSDPLQACQARWAPAMCKQGPTLPIEGTIICMGEGGWSGSGQRPAACGTGACTWGMLHGVGTEACAPQHASPVTGATCALAAAPARAHHDSPARHEQGAGPDEQRQAVAQQRGLDDDN